MKNIVLSVLVLAFTASFSFAQYELECSVVGSAGFEENSTGNSLGVSMGEAIVQYSLVGAYDTSTEFQQGEFISSVVEKIPEESTFDMNLYPVPTKSVLNIDFGEFVSEYLSISIWSIDDHNLQSSF